MKPKSILPIAQLATAWLTTFIVGTELFVMSPLLPLLAKDFNISAAGAGMSVTIFALTYIVSAPVLGHVADRVGKRRVLIGCLLALAASNLLTASAANLPALLIARLFAGAAAAGVAPSLYALVENAAPANRRATWLGLVVSGLLVALALGASAGSLAAARFGWV